MTYLYRALPRIRHDVNGLSVVRILSKTSTKRLRSVGDQADVGSTISFIFINVSVTLLFFCALAYRTHLALRRDDASLLR